MSTIPHILTTAAAIVAPSPTAPPSPVFDGVMVSVEMDGRLQRVQLGVVVPRLRLLRSSVAVGRAGYRDAQVELGRLLLIIKEQVGHGWMSTVYEHADINPRTAQRCMRVAKALADSAVATQEATRKAGISAKSDATNQNRWGIEATHKAGETVKSGGNDLNRWGPEVRLTHLVQGTAGRVNRRPTPGSESRGTQHLGGRHVATSNVSSPLPSPRPVILPEAPAAEMPPALRRERVQAVQAGGKQMELASEYQAAAVRRAREVGLRIERAGMPSGLAKAIGELTDRWAGEVERLLMSAPGVV